VTKEKKKTLTTLIYVACTAICHFFLMLYVLASPRVKLPVSFCQLRGEYILK